MHMARLYIMTQTTQLSVWLEMPHMLVVKLLTEYSIVVHDHLHEQTEGG
jgi:hypothetical protein